MRLYRYAVLTLVIAVCTTANAAEYFVAPDGDDEAPGTQAAPLRTIQHAADIMSPGDTCLMRAGTYRETVRPKASGTADRPLRFAAFEKETVTISGADPLQTSWSVHEGRIFRASTARQFIQLFADGQMMLQARWPNSPLDDLMAMTRAKAGKGTDYDSLADPELPQGDWEGAQVLIWPGARWTNYTRRVVDYKPGESFRFDRDFRPTKPDQYHEFDPRKPKEGNPYILSGRLAALDSPGEWFLDADEGAVYLWPVGDGAPDDGLIEVKQRDLAFDLSGLAHIELSGLRIFAAAINMTDSQSCVVQDCRLRYVDHFDEMPGGKVPAARNVVTGRDNEWRHCSIAYSAGSALRMAGKGNRLENCIVHDANYLGTYQGALDVCRSEDAVVRKCTLCRAGRDIVQHHGSQRIRIEYNDLFGANMLNNDSGAIYSWGTDGDGGVIAYNWSHDNTGDATVGIYLDNFCKNFTVHHNVVWGNSGNGITLNSDSVNNLVCNNTILRNRRTLGVYTYSGRVPTQEGTKVLNNLVAPRLRVSDPRVFVQGDLAPQVERNGPYAIDERGVPVAGSGAIDAGVVVPGVNENYVGPAPDIGAYEHGAPYWTPGADWTDEDTPTYPPIDVSYEPHPPVTQQAMLTAGLQLWLDAADETTLSLDEKGRVLGWRDKAGSAREARGGAHSAPRLQKDAMNGLPVVRGSGTGSMELAGAMRVDHGPLTAFVVSQAVEASGPQWQRIIAASCGEGDDWVAPNWNIMRPGGEKPAAYPPRVFVVRFADGRVLDHLTLFGPATTSPQFLAADIAEVLIYDRQLDPDEEDAIIDYLSARWGVSR